MLWNAIKIQLPESTVVQIKESPDWVVKHKGGAQKATGFSQSLTYPAKGAWMEDALPWTVEKLLSTKIDQAMRSIKMDPDLTTKGSFVQQTGSSCMEDEWQWAV